MIGPWLRRTITPLLGLALLKLFVSGIAIAQGVTAISDDDFARVVIAQGFAERPSLDPSGTSWLPLPFWVYGAPMLVLGDSWEVARGLAVALGVVAVWLLWLAARLFGATPRSALIGAALAAVFPYSAWLGVTTIPELPAASLTLFALACSARCAGLLRDESKLQGPPSRLPLPCALLGGLAISAACASRYEAWPVALGLACATLWDARTALGRGTALARQGSSERDSVERNAAERNAVERNAVERNAAERNAAERNAAERNAARNALGWGLAALLPLSFPLAWLLHGHFVHGDFLFFVRRVTEYKQALSGLQSPLTETLVTYPVAFVRGEPELVFGGAVLLVVAKTQLAWRRAASLLALLLVVLVLSDLRGGGPTHHPERALLTGWLLVALLVGDGLHRLPGAALLRPRARRWLLAGALVTVGAGTHWVRRPDLTTASFRQRGPELAAGRRLRELTSRAEPVVVASDDYGYFAVLAALGAPSRAHVLDRNDPRQAAPRGARLDRLRELAATTGSRWLALPRSWSPDPALGREMSEGQPFAVLSTSPEAGENSPHRARLH